MTTLNTTTRHSGTSTVTDRFRLPDIPQREPDEMTSYDHIHAPGSSHHLIQHFGSSDTTLVTADRYIVLTPHPTGTDTIRRYPDLLIAFDVDPVAYRDSNGYVISEQGKPPDFVMEVASESTADRDVGEKRDDYAALGIPEYWRFDETGEYHGERLSGEVLVEGEYRSLPIERLSEDTFQGYSAVLGLHIRWSAGRLEWYDPATGRHIVTFDDERAGRIQAETRVRELEDELRRLRDS